MLFQDFSGTLTILSAMITPVVLILATGQLILTTSQRLGRCIERARSLSSQFEELMEKKNEPVNEKKKELLFVLLNKAAHRSRKLQQAMSMLYLALSVFVATSVSIGLLEISGLLVLWVPVVLGIFGAAFLFYATVLLVLETRMALTAVDKEMKYLLTTYRKDLLKVMREAEKEE